MVRVFQRRRSDPFFWERGPVACLLLHGFGGSPAELRPLGTYLADRGMTVRAPLLPGHGTDPEDLARVRWPDWVGAAEAELQTLQQRYGGVHVTGFSMGGLLALYLGARCPVSSLVTLACPWALTDRRQFIIPVARYFVRYYPARPSRPEVAAESGSYDRLPLHGVYNLLQLIRRVRRDLPRVTAPILAIQGDRDRVITPDSADRILARVSSSEREQRVFPGRSHMITLEQGREEVFGLVADWVMRHGEDFRG